MAAAGPFQSIKEQVTCPICLELFRDPVTSACGHSFCRECIARHCQGDGDVLCPLCNEKLRKGNLRPNRELKNIVELVKSQAVEDPRGGYVCKTHREPLRFYCKEDETPVCMACERSWAHRTHTVVPVEDVIQEHRESIRKHLEGIESSYQKLHLFVTMDRTYLPQSAREEEHQRLKRLTDNVATLLKVDTEGPRQRSKGAVSQTQPCDPSKVAGKTESQEHKGREPGSEPAAEKQEETRTHVVHVCEEAPTPKYGLDQATLDPAVHTIRSTRVFEKSKVDVKGRRSRGDSPTSPAPSEVSAGDQAGVSPAGQGAAQTESGGHTGREPGSEPAAEKQEETGSHVSPVGEEAPTPKYGLDQASLDPTIQDISNTTEGAEPQVDAMSLSSRYEDATSPPSVDPARSRKDGASSGGNVAALTELPKEKDGETPVVRRRKVSLPASEEHEPLPSTRASSCSTGLFTKEDAKRLTTSPQDLSSVGAALEPGWRRQDGVSPAGNEPWNFKSAGANVGLGAVLCLGIAVVVLLACVMVWGIHTFLLRN